MKRKGDALGLFAARGVGVLAILAALALAGCASAPPRRVPDADSIAKPPAEPVKQAEPEKPAEPVKPAEPAELAEARNLVEEASPDSLSDAARLLATEALAGKPAAANLSGAGRAMYDALFPETPNPFSADAPAFSEKGPGASNFLAKVFPAIPLLLPGSTVDESKAARLQSALKEADGLNPRSVLPPYLLGLLEERREKNSDPALALFNECVRRAPSFYPAKARIAGILAAKGKAAEALPFLRELASMLPPDPGRYRAVARAALAAGEPQEAADAAARALLQAPDAPDLVLLRAQAFEALGNWYQALWLLDALLKLKPDESGAALMKARLLWDKAGDGSGAIRILAKAESKFPSDPAFPELQGRILLSKGMHEEGIAAVTRALALDPGRVPSFALLAAEAAREEKWAEASVWLERIPEDSRTGEHLLLGWRIATNLGEHERALGFARTLEAKVGGETPPLLEARSLLSAGRGPEALETVDKGLAVTATPGLRSQLYLVRARSGSDDPLRDLRSALHEDPDNIEALMAIMALLIDSGEYRKALAYLKHAAALLPDDSAIASRVKELETLAESEQ